MTRLVSWQHGSAPAKLWAKMVTEIQVLERQLEAIKEQAKALLGNLAAGELAKRPAPSAWSVAECLEHLNKTARVSLSMTEEALDKAEVDGLLRQGKFHTRLLVRLFIRSLEPPVSLFRSKTTSAFIPPAELDVEAVKHEFFELQEKLLLQLSHLDNYDLNKIKVQSPFAKRISYNLYEWWQVMLAHERRHLWQAEETLSKLRETDKYPNS